MMSETEKPTIFAGEYVFTHGCRFIFRPLGRIITLTSDHWPIGLTVFDLEDKQIKWIFHRNPTYGQIFEEFDSWEQANRILIGSHGGGDWQITSKNSPYYNDDNVIRPTFQTCYLKPSRITDKQQEALTEFTDKCSPKSVALDMACYMWGLEREIK